MEAEHPRSVERRVEAGATEVRMDDAARRQERIVAAHAGAEPEAELDEDPSDGAEADDGDLAFLDLGADPARPLAVAHAEMGRHDVAQAGEGEGEGKFGDSAGVGAFGTADLDAARFDGGEGEIVDVRCRCAR